MGVEATLRNRFHSIAESVICRQNRDRKEQRLSTRPASTNRWIIWLLLAFVPLALLAARSAQQSAFERPLGVAVAKVLPTVAAADSVSATPSKSPHSIHTKSAGDDPPSTEAVEVPVKAQAAEGARAKQESESSKSSSSRQSAAPIKTTPVSLEDLTNLQSAIQLAVQKGLPATVGIRLSDRYSEASTFGSGVIVSEDGYVLTAGHVAAIPGRNAWLTLADGKRVQAKTLGVYPEMDCGMLKIVKDGKYPYVELGKSGDLKLGDWCVTLGHPGGIQPGRPAVARAGRVLLIRSDAIQTDCTIVGGDSGGPLLDTQGRLVGIHSRISNEWTENYHVPIDRFRESWERLAKGEYWGGPALPGPKIGINGKTDDQGCRVVSVYPNTPADKAGVKADDIVVGFDGEPITNLGALQVQLWQHKLGDEIVLGLMRNGEKLELKVLLSPLRPSIESRPN
jgi:serine protease Do